MPVLKKWSCKNCHWIPAVIGKQKFTFWKSCLATFKDSALLTALSLKP